MAMRYPEFKPNSSPTPMTGVVCDKCAKLSWEMIKNTLPRCSCGTKYRYATESEKRDAETFIQHVNSFK